MTTQHTHSDHSDADTTVVEHSPVSETETDHSPQSSQAVPVPDEDTQQTQYTRESAGTSFEDSQDVSTAEPVEPPLSSSLVVEEEVRPFTDFIEEFRQAEARFSASLQEYQTSPLPSHTSPPEEVEAGRNEENTTPVPNTVDEVETVAQFVTSHANDVPNEPVVVQSTIEQDGGTPALSTAEAQTPVVSETAETKPTVVPPAARPVSPLLRPATPRGRTPRHVSSRHHEAPPTVTPTPPPASTETVEPTPVVEQVPVASEPPVEEQPRPARRYRFDRPSKVNTPATPVTPTVNTPPAAPLAARVDEGKDVAERETPAVAVRPNNGHQFNGQTSERENTEPVASKQPVASELPAVENTAAPVAPSAQEERRRRHSQERQRVKAQPVAAPTPVVPSPVVEVVPPVATPVAPVVAQVQGSEVSPEDLPPLEYSELQKANSRRRRRRHTGTTVAPAAVVANTPLPPTSKVAATVVPELSAPIAPITPVVAPPPVSPTVSPRPTAASAATPASAVPPAAAFTLTSGYTVNQMNQNHEGKNPFMGPDPSPARGTMAAQTARSIRTDVQRVPAYPVRTTEATSASVHQLANVVSQAIQTQTDRMIAELRRANQGPTNISVSMPPMPSNERVGVFVDVANLLYSARTLRMTVDFGKLLDFLRGNRRLIRAQAYCPTSPQPGDEQMFLQAVKGLGYRITTKNYKIFASGAKKADLDLDLCMDVVRLVDGKAVDCIVLVSGDSDFMPMLDYCSDHGVRVEVAAFDEAMSATLRQSCDLFINLSMLEEIRV